MILIDSYLEFAAPVRLRLGDDVTILNQHDLTHHIYYAQHVGGGLVAVG
jgi:hypothetical protein